MLENKIFEEIQIGDTATQEKIIAEKDLLFFALSCGDFNPVHFDAPYAETTPFGERIAHGMLLGSFFSALIANQLPGPGTVYVSQSLNFKRPVKLADKLQIQIKIVEKIEKGNRAILQCSIKNQHGKECVSGIAEVIVPTQKIQIENHKPPQANALEAVFSH